MANERKFLDLEILDPIPSSEELPFTFFNASYKPFTSFGLNQEESNHRDRIDLKSKIYFPIPRTSFESESSGPYTLRIDKAFLSFSNAYLDNYFRKPYLATIEFYQSAQEKQLRHLLDYYRKLGLANFLGNEFLFQEIVAKILISDNDHYQI